MKAKNKARPPVHILSITDRLVFPAGKRAFYIRGINEN